MGYKSVTDNMGGLQ